VEFTALTNDDTDTLSKKEVLARGLEAEALLTNSVLSLAFDDMLQNIMERFLDSHSEEEVIYDLHTQAVAIKSVRGTLTRYLNDMKVQMENARLDKEMQNNG
jgi:hypothetical protein